MATEVTGAPQLTRRVLLASLVITAVLYLVPAGELVARPLVLVSTLVHELGHGVAALLVGGDFLRLEVFSDASGVATTAVRPGWRQAWVSAGGLVGPAVFAALGFALARRPTWARVAVLLGGLFGLVATALWVRGWVGLTVSLVLALVSLVVALVVRQPWGPQLWLVFLAVQMGLSVFSRGEYLFASSARTGAGAGRSDSQAIAEVLVGPHWLWGALCGLVSVAALVLGVRWFWRAGPTPEDPTGPAGPTFDLEG